MLTESSIIGTILLLLLALYTACPYIFYYCKRIRNAGLFANRLNIPHPWFYNLKNPTSFGLEFAENHTIYLERGLINIWTIISGIPFLKNNKKTLVLYCHGNSCNRAMSHRVGLYKKILEMGLDVVTFDYRGFGDSTGLLPDENTVVEDTLAMIEWTACEFPDHNIILWGHSLGTGIAVKTLTSPQFENDQIKGLVLESPFLNSGEAGRHIPIAKFFELLPFTRGVIGSALEGMFPTDQLIDKVKIPILLLHAQNDGILPIHHSRLLYKACTDKGMDNVTCKEFTEGNHKYLFENKETMITASDFIKDLVL